MKRVGLEKWGCLPEPPLSLESLFFWGIWVGLAHTWLCLTPDSMLGGPCMVLGLHPGPFPVPLGPEKAFSASGPTALRGAQGAARPCPLSSLLVGFSQATLTPLCPHGVMLWSPCDSLPAGVVAIQAQSAEAEAGLGDANSFRRELHLAWQEAGKHADLFKGTYLYSGHFLGCFECGQRSRTSL